MKRPLLSGALTPIAVAGMAAALMLLAGLQYRWIGEMAEADRQRLERGADAAAQQLRGDFNRELRRLARSFDIGQEAVRGREWQRFVDRLTNWRTANPDSIQVQDLFVREFSGEGEGEAWRLVPDQRSLLRGELPAELGDGFPRGQFRGPGGGFRGFGRPGVTFSSSPPMLTFVLVSFHRPEQGAPRPGLAGIMGLMLDPASLREGLLPELTQRYFGDVGESVYDIAVVNEGGFAPPVLVYASRPGTEVSSFEDALVRLPLFWRRDEGPPQGRGRGGRGGPRGPGRGEPGDGFFDAIAPGGPGGEWMLVVRPAGGSVDAVVAGLRRRNLAISLGILALLGAGMAILLISSRRAERLARLQMEFVAGVSHELRTPLAVIRSAGDNLAEGVIRESEQVRDYGKLIRDEGRRLTGMVEQTLQFASTQAGRQSYKVESVPAGETSATGGGRAAAGGGGGGICALEQEFEPALPEVSMDVAAASRILQSLVENALKYGGESKRVRIEAAARNGDVEVTVRDNGVGIDAEDLPHIFEPFYRGKRATEAQIHGTGLGLSLAKSAAEGFGGKLRAESRPREGSAFTLTIPGAAKGLRDA